MKLPISAEERQLLTELFAPGRAIVAFAADTATASPASRICRAPIWTTWPAYWACISSS